MSGIHPEKQKYMFIVEWFDKSADLTRQYQLFNYSIDNSIEMYDIRNQRLFLRRTMDQNFRLDNMFIGARVMVFGRLLEVVEYGDVFTRQNFEGLKESTFGMIKPNSYLDIGKIIQMVQESGLQIGRLKMSRMTKHNAQQFYLEHKDKPFYQTLVDFMSSDLIVGMELVGQNAISRWRSLLGPTNSLVAKQQQPKCIRARFGIDGTKNSCHGSDSLLSAKRELEFYFGKGSQMQQTVQLNNCTCVIVKPHIIKNGQLGNVIDHILKQGFEVSAMEMLRINHQIAHEFFELYRDVLPEYSPMVDEVVNGDIVVIEVRQENAVQSFRKVAGPHDPAIAKTIRKTTIRSIFGNTVSQNAIHCTDLQQDGPLECAYFFDLLANTKF